MGLLKFATFSQFAFGEAVFGEESNTPTITQNFVSDGPMRSQYGWGQRTARGWTRPELYELTPQAAADVGDITITISSVSGAVLGEIRTDIQRPILNSLEFTLDESGCADFTLKLAKLPNFEILPYSILDVTIANDADFKYSGVVTFADEAGTRGGSFESTRNRPFEFRGFGLRKYMENLRADVDFASLLDVGEVARQLFRNYVVGVDEVAPFSPIRYSESKINSNTGVVLANTVELGKFSLRQVFDTLSQMASARWGVDGEGQTFFEQSTDVPVRTFAIGYRLNNFEPKLNYDTIKNAIIVQRQEGRASGAAGWAVAGIYNDTASVRKYGRNELVYQIPGFFDDSDADIIGEALRDSLSEPKFSCELEGIQVLSEIDYLRRGTYRFIMPLAEYRETIADIDSASDFSIVGAGDLTVENDTTFGNYVFADGGVKLTFQNAANQRAELDVLAEGIIKQIRFYVKTTVPGALLTVGVGENQWDEYTTDIDVQVRDEFIPFVWDVSELNLRRIQKFAVKVKANQSQSVNMWIDKLDVIYRGHQTYKMELKRVTYTFSPQGSFMNAEFGEIPKRISDYVTGLLATSQEMRFITEIR